jgi:hypothetical protein
VEFQTLLMFLLGTANVPQIIEANAEDHTEAVTVATEIMTAVDENGTRRTRWRMTHAGAAADHPVVAAVAADHRVVEAMEFQTLMMDDSLYKLLDTNLATPMPHAQTDVAAKAKSSLCYHLRPSQQENLEIISSRSRT